MTDNLHLSHGPARRTAMERLSAPTSNLAAASGRVILVGEDNPLSSKPEHALLHVPHGHAGHRLQSLVLGVPSYVYLAFWRVNLCARSWDMKEARRRANNDILDPTSPWDLVVMLGAKVATAFMPADSTAVKMEPFTSRQYMARTSKVFTLVSIPHPSARCRTWNEPDAVQRARDLLSTLAPDVPWGTL